MFVLVLVLTFILNSMVIAFTIVLTAVVVGVVEIIVAIIIGIVDIVIVAAFAHVLCISIHTKMSLRVCLVLWSRPSYQ